MADTNSKADVLYAFSIEETHDRETVHRYLTKYPDYASDFLDLVSQIRANNSAESLQGNEVLPDPKLMSAFDMLLGRNSEAIVDPFATFKGAAFVELASSIKLPREILIAFRDRLVETASIPHRYLERLASKSQLTLENIARYLNQPSLSTAVLRFSSLEKPKTLSKVSFQHLVENTALTEDERKELLAE